MNPDLAKALGEIEKGAERRLQVKRAEFEKFQQELGERQKIVGHVEKIEEPGEEEVAAKVSELEVVQVEKGTTAGAETVETEGRQRRKTQSVAAIKKRQRQPRLNSKRNYGRKRRNGEELPRKVWMMLT